MKNYNFIKAKNIIWGISITLSLISISSLLIKGLNLSLEFTGGMQLTVKFAKPVYIGYLDSKLRKINLNNAKIQNYGSTKDFLIRVNNQNQDTNNIINTLSSNSNIAELKKTEYIGSEVGEQLLKQGVIAVLVAILFTMVYIIIRFEYRLAISAALTLLHNAILVLGVFSVTGYQFDLAALAALLAIIGYSLNDTIVIFDRIRENFRKYHKETVAEVINIAINQTLSRTFMTSMLTLLVVLSLLFFGGNSLFGFSLALTIGIIVGTYASIGLAGSLAWRIGLSRKDFLKHASLPKYSN